MKPVIAFSIFILCSTSALTAQNNDNKFSKAVDFVNCKTIELSLQQSSNKEALKTFRDNCDCGTFPDYEKIKKAIPGEMTATMALSEEINKIKEDSNTVNSTEAIEYLGKKIFSDNDRYKKIVSFRKNRDADGTFEAFQQEITKKIIEILPPADSEEGVDQNNQKAGTDIKNTDLPHFPPNKGSFIVWQLNILTLILVTAGIAVLFTRIKRSEKKRFADQTTAISKNINRSMSDNEMERSRSQNALLRNINALSARMDRIEEIQKNIMTSYQRTIPREEEKKPPNIPEDPEKSHSNIFFASIPDENGCFMVSTLYTSFQPSASIYKIIKQSDHQATFQFENREEAMRLAIKFPNESINPVCEPLNPYNARAKCIITETSGKLELTGDRWKVIQKAKIRYE